MNAWATLLTRPNYLAGVRTLHASLRRAGSPYPLVVMVTAGVDADVRRQLAGDGCVVHEVTPLGPPDDGRDGYANARFAEVWTKLAAWGLTDYDRVVFLDADMLVTRNMDELFDVELPGDGIAACHACRCNPEHIASYPRDWVPANCGYTTGADLSQPYLNGGLLVLRPDADVHADLLGRVAAIDDLGGYPFAEQDLLNEHYAGRWLPLPYVYNALKTLPYQHPSLWVDGDVKNIHYIIDKPWQRRPDPTDRYFDVDTLWWDVATGAGTAPLVASARSA